MTPHLCTADQRMNDFARTHNTPYILNTNSTALSTNLIPVLALIVCMNNDKTWPRCIYYIPFFRNFPVCRSGYCVIFILPCCYPCGQIQALLLPIICV